jgi:lysine-N-methylase
MPKVMLPMLVPQYVKKFACIGTECSDSCCRDGWQIPIDKKTYKKYVKLKDDELSPKLNKILKRNRQDANSANYALFQQESGCDCPMLNESGLCSIQLKLGESYLSQTCSVYPRIPNQINGVMEVSLTLSCPEAARLALLNPDGIEFDETEEEVDTDLVLNRKLETEGRSGVELYFWELRIFTITVLQNRAYELADRLIVLGMFYKQAQELVDSGKAEELPQLIALYHQLLEEGSLKESLAGIPSQVMIQINLIKKLSEYRLYIGASEKYQGYYVEFLKGIQYEQECTLDELSAHYQAAYDQYYRPAMDELGYILENYLVNQVFSRVFPMRDQSTNLFGEYILLVTRYSMVKMHLIGIAAHRQGLNAEVIVDLISKISRNIEHNNSFIEFMLKMLEESKSATLAHMAILIKN